MEEEIGYEQLADPQHFLFDPKWYLICDIPDDDPWFWIVDRFMGARLTVQSNGFKVPTVVTKKLAESSKSKEAVRVSGEELCHYVGVVEELISKRELSVEFLQLWGEFERCFAKFEIISPQLIKRQRAQSDNRQLQKQWYSLWVAERGSMTINSLDRYLEELCDDIINDRIIPPDGWGGNKLRNFVADMSDSQRSTRRNRKFFLASTYDKTNLPASERELLATKARKNRNIPPVGSSCYIRK